MENLSNKSKWTKSASGYKVEISLKDWVNIGYNSGFFKSAMSKSAMPVMTPSPGTQRQLNQEGWGILPDINNTLSGIQKKEIKLNLENAGLSTSGLFLPKVFRLKDENLVSLEGKTYYYLHHDIKADKLWLLDPNTYSPREMSYKENISKLGLTDDARREAIAEKMNKAIEAWNGKLEKLDKGVGLITIPLRIKRILPLIDARVAELEGQKRGFEQREGGRTEGMIAYEKESKESLISGVKHDGTPFNEQDAIDTASFWYLQKKDIDGLLRDVNSFNLDPKVKTALINLANAEKQKLLEKDENKVQKQDDWNNRLDTDALPQAEPNLNAVPPISPEDLPQGSAKKPMGFNHPDNMSRQSYQVIKKLDDQLLVLNNVKEAFIGIQSAIKGVPELKKEFLTTTDEGRSFSEKLSMLHGISKDFLRKYERDVFGPDGQVQKNIFNNTGGTGNAELVIEMNRLQSAIEASISGLNTSSVVPQMAGVQASSKNNSKLVKTASGKMVAKISFEDWVTIGKKASWIKKINSGEKLS